MPYYDKQGNHVDTSNLWRMPSYQAQQVYDSLSHNKPKNFTTPHQDYRKIGGRSHGGYNGPGIETDGILTFIASLVMIAFSLAKWLLFRGGIMLTTTVFYLFVTSALVFDEWRLFSDTALILMGSAIIGCLLMAGLAGMMITLNQIAKEQGGNLSVFDVLVSAIDGWLKTAVFGTSLILLPVLTFYAAIMLNSEEITHEVVWLLLPGLVALAHIAFTPLIKRRYALALMATGLVAGAGTFALTF